MRFLASIFSLALTVALIAALFPIVDSAAISPQYDSHGSPLPVPDAVVYEDDFDGESDGDSPPINWVNQNLDVLEVDDDGFEKSAPNSMKVEANSGGVYWGHTDQAINEANITYWVYFNNLGRYYYVAGQETTGNLDNTKVGGMVCFRANDIKWNDGAWQDTGVDYTVGWHEIWMIHDLAADTFDFWYDSTLLVDDGGFKDGNTLSAIASLQVGASSAGGVATSWMDNFTISTDSDTTPPEIANLTETPEPQEYNGNVNITADITDETAMDTVYINVSYPNATYTNTTMTDGAGDEYYYNTTYTLIGQYNYTIWANDTSDNWNSSAVTFFNITDTTLPVIYNVTAIPDPQEYNGYVNISANISDGYSLDSVFVNVSYPNSTYVNTSMTSGASDSYYYNTTYTLVGSHDYKIWANDSSDNWNSSTGSFFVIQDTTPPEIANITHPTIELGAWNNFTFNISDYSGVDSAAINFTHPDTSTFNFTVNYSGSGDDYWFNSTYDNLLNQTGTYSYSLYANDTYDNWNGSLSNTFWVNDTTNPVIVNETATPNTVYQYNYINITARVTDLGGVSSVWVTIVYNDNTTENRTMIEGVNNTWYNNSAYSKIGYHVYFVLAQDNSNNTEQTANHSIRVEMPPVPQAPAPGSNTNDSQTMGFVFDDPEPEEAGFFEDCCGTTFSMIGIAIFGICLTPSVRNRIKQLLAHFKDRPK